MLPHDTPLHVYNGQGTVLCNGSVEGGGETNGYKAITGRGRRKSPKREHPFLPEELTDRIIEFAKSFGFKIIVLAKVGKLVRSNRPINEMSAYCCIYYVDNNALLKCGLARYHKGKISIFDQTCCGREKWLTSFRLAYEETAKEVLHAVLQDSLNPVVAAGLFLKSNDTSS